VPRPAQSARESEQADMPWSQKGKSSAIPFPGTLCPIYFSWKSKIQAQLEFQAGQRVCFPINSTLVLEML
jgi:hypothetical protein